MPSQIKERPILFSSSMIRAILENRKFQTRRVVKDRKPKFQSIISRAEKVGWCDGIIDGVKLGVEGWVFEIGKMDEAVKLDCPYGQVGDRLWVRETFHPEPSHKGPASYRATWPKDDEPPDEGWKPSIFMRRAQSRITLEITGVRVERLQDISEEDAIAEGADAPDGRNGTYPCPWGNSKPGPMNYRESYRMLWEHINGPGSWAKNPWVWKIEFKLV